MIFICSLLVVFFIHDDNYTKLQKKISELKNRNGNQTHEHEQISMDKMEDIQALKENLKTNPDNYEILIDLGNNYFDVGMYEPAIEQYGKALSLKNDDTNVLIDMGVAYFNIHKPDSALLYMNRALEIDPKHKQGLYNIGIVLYNIDEKSEAIHYWKKLIAFHPGSREAEAAEKFIKQINLN